MKRVVIICSLIIVVLVLGSLIIGLSEDITIFSGVLEENNSSQKVEITLKGRKIDRLFKVKKGELCVRREDDTEYIYRFSGQLFDIDDYFASAVYRKGNMGLETHGYFLFDSKMQNIAIITTKECVYAADEEFVKKIENFR